MKTANLFFSFLLMIGFVLAPLTEAVADTPPTDSGISISTGKININAADAPLLAKTLKGVGMKKAQAIIEYRKTYGDFHNIQELQDVSGIGPATMEKNAGLIAVE